MKHTLREAAELAGISRPTIYRHVRQGKVSASLDHDGNKVIETAELMRAYGELRQGETQPVRQVETGSETAGLLADLIQEVKLLREDNRKLNEKIEQIAIGLIEDKSKAVPDLSVVAGIDTGPEEKKKSKKSRHSFRSVIDAMKADQAAKDKSRG